MMAGRNISATHVALSATRVQLTTGTIGQAVGTAAGMCINKNLDPRGIYQNYLMELQQKLIKDGAYIIEMPNMDSNDLALRAVTKASSELQPASEAINGFSRVRLPTVFPGLDLKLNAWIPDTNSVKPQWLQLSWDKPQKFNVVHLVFQNRGNLASKKFTLEYQTDNNWVKIAEVDNIHAFRRLVIPVGNIKTKAFRIVLNDQELHGGICEVRIYHEQPEKIEMIKRINRTMEKPIENVSLPWEL
jgi:hypothetical protein